MKKLYRRRGTVHPIISDHLSFLPASILTLAAALSPEDREVLAYLISSCSNDFTFTTANNLSGHRGKAQPAHQKPASAAAAAKSGSDHPPVFSCDCFRCYTSYWARWDSSPNRQLIHEIIDAYEEGLAQFQTRIGKNNKKERKKRNTGAGSGSSEGKGSEPDPTEEESRPREIEMAAAGDIGGGGEDETEKGSVRRIVSFIGERIWGAWN